MQTARRRTNPPLTACALTPSLGRLAPLRWQRQTGIALVSALLILVMLTLLALSMFRSFGLEQKIAGNVREKERAFQAAQSALQFGESWLLAMSTQPPTDATRQQTCRDNPAFASTGDLRICFDELPTPTNPQNWIGAGTYIPPAMVVLAGGGMATDGNGNADIRYAAMPILYINRIGKNLFTNLCEYRVSAAGFGGSTTSTSVVQSVVALPEAFCIEAVDS